MAEIDNLFSRLKRLFSVGVVVRHAGGKQLKVADTDHIQQYMSNQYKDRYSRIFSSSGMGNALSNQYGMNMAYQTQRIMLFREYDIMDNDPLINAALDIFAEECTLKNEYGDILTIECDDENIKEILHNLFYDILNIQHTLWPWIRNMCKYGDQFLFLEISEKYGIVNVQPLSVYDTIRVEGEDPKNPRYVYFQTLGMNGKKVKFENYEMCHFRLASDSNFLPYGKCLHGDTSVWTPVGPVKLKDINVGDVVYSFDTTTHTLVPSRVLNWAKTGKKQLFEVRTATNRIKATENHPFLLSTGEYKPLRDLTTDDYIVLPNVVDGTTDSLVTLLESAPTGTNRASANNIDTDRLLAYLPEFIRFFGFMLGDGWSEANIASFSLGDRLDKSTKYVEYINNFGLTPHILQENTTRAYCGVYSTHFVNILTHCGFKTGTRNKCIPAWVYELPQRLLVEFLMGFADADGCVVKNGWSVSGVNETLIKDLHHIAQLAGFNAATPTATPACKNTWGGISGPMFQFRFLITHKNSKLVSTTERHQRIWNIEPLEVEDVYDIELDNTNHNFVANGIVVHNSAIEGARRTWKQLTLLEDAMLIHRIMRAPEKRVIKLDIGNIPPAEVDTYMQRITDKMKKVPFIDNQTGDYNLRYNMQNILEDIYIPVRGGDSGTEITNLGGLEFNSIEDVEYIRNRMMTALKIPKPFLGYDENINGKLTLAAEDVRFARTIERLQDIICGELQKMAIVHLYAQGFVDEDLVNFNLKLTIPSTIYEQEKLNLWKEKIQTASDAQNLKLIGSDWIYKNIFNFSEDEIEEHRETVIADTKRQFRQAKIEAGESDPAKYGYPQDDAPPDSSFAGGEQEGTESGGGESEAPPETPPSEESADMGESSGPGRPQLGSKYGQDSHPRGRDPLGNDERYHVIRHSMEKTRTPSRKSPLALEIQRYGLDRLSQKKPTSVLSEEIQPIDRGTFLDEDIIKRHHIEEDPDINLE